MIARDELDGLRRYLADPLHVCTVLGLRRSAKRQAGGLLVLCPWHQEKTASCSVTRGSDGTLRANCFSCGAAGDVLSLVAAVRGLDLDRDFKEVVEEASAIAGKAPPDSSRIEAIPDDIPRAAARLADDRFSSIIAPLAHLGRLDDSRVAGDVTAYLTKRGLIEEARRDGWFALPAAGEAQVGWCGVLRDCFAPDDLDRSGLFARRGFVWPEHRLCIPWRARDGTIVTLQRRRLDDVQPKYVFPKARRPAAAYGVEHLAGVRASMPIALVEGAVDVLATRAIYGAVGIRRLPLGLPGLAGWRREWAELGRKRKVYIAFDADAAGEAAVERVARQLYDAGAADVIRVVPEHGKDWAQALLELRITP